MISSQKLKFIPLLKE